MKPNQSVLKQKPITDQTPNVSNRQCAHEDWLELNSKRNQSQTQTSTNAKHEQPKRALHSQGQNSTVGD